MNSKLTWILLASLLINAALVGFLIGNHGRGGPMDVLRRMPPPGMSGPHADDTTRGVLKNAFDAERDNLRKSMKEVVAAREESEAILRQDPLDLEKLDAAMTRMRASSSALQEIFHRALREAATKLDGPQRAALGRMLERAPSGRMLMNERRMGGGPGGPGGGMFVDMMDGPRGPPPEAPGPQPTPLPPGMGLGAPAPASLPPPPPPQ